MLLSIEPSLQPPCRHLVVWSENPDILVIVMRPLLSGDDAAGGLMSYITAHV